MTQFSKVEKGFFMQRVSLEVKRPAVFVDNKLIRKVENPKDTCTQAKYDFLVTAEQRLGALRHDATPNQIAGELNLLKMGITRRKGELDKTTEEHSVYFAHYFHDISLKHILDKDVNPYTLLTYKAAGMCISVQGYAVWFAEEHGKLCLYFGKEPIQVS